MELKHSAVGLLIYAAMAAWALAFVGHALGRRRAGEACFGLGGCVLLGAFGLRWVRVGHPPLQSMFEVFLCLGMLFWPLWVLCRRRLGARGSAAAALVGVAVLVPAGFIFSARSQRLPPALQSGLFVPHVAAYMLSYVLLVLAAVQAVLQLARHRAGDQPRALAHEAATCSMVRLGFPLLTLGLLLGSVWGQRAWGAHWNWDPKELWSLATWLVYAGYLHWRRMQGRRFPRINALMAIGGGAAVMITLVWVNLAARLFGGLHVYAAP